MFLRANLCLHFTRARRYYIQSIETYSHHSLEQMFRQSCKSAVSQIFPHHSIWLSTINNGEDDVTTMDAATSKVRNKNFDIFMLQVKIWNRKDVDNISTIASCLTWCNSDIYPFLSKITLSSNVKCKNLSSFPIWKAFSKAPFSKRISVDGTTNRRNKAAESSRAYCAQGLKENHSSSEPILQRIEIPRWRKFIFFLILLT